MSLIGLTSEYYVHNPLRLWEYSDEIQYDDFISLIHDYRIASVSWEQ